VEDEIVRIEISDELDLHHFNPADVKAVLAEFIDTAAERGVHSVRIVHGKGRSVIKSMVASELKKNGRVVAFGDEAGNWGATVVRLKPGRAEGNGG
jgi:DNA-nicking Smr family endonuclease